MENTAAHSNFFVLKTIQTCHYIPIFVKHRTELWQLAICSPFWVYRALNEHTVVETESHTGGWYLPWKSTWSIWFLSAEMDALRWMPLPNLKKKKKKKTKKKTRNLRDLVCWVASKLQFSEERNSSLFWNDKIKFENPYVRKQRRNPFVRFLTWFNSWVNYLNIRKSLG